MSFLSDLIGGSDMIKSVGNTLDKLVTSDEERMEAQNEITKAMRNFDHLSDTLVLKQNLAQIEVSKLDAQSTQFFQSGWRPAIGWIGALSLAYQFIVYPIALWIAKAWPEYVAPDPMNADMMFTIITGMLGIAGMRSYDKMKKTDSKI